MIFNSFEFLFLFLPIAVLGYYTLIKYLNFKCATIWIFLSSLFYYAYWDINNLKIIIFSIVFNYVIGQNILKQNHSCNGASGKLFFITGVVVNIMLLSFYKYTDFAIENINSIFSTSFAYLNIVLPIGISFFTFQQIAYLSDIFTKKHTLTTGSFWEYCCFVCFFPQLVAGPIVHHSEMMPQFKDPQNGTLKLNYVYSGLVTIFIGLFKKVCIADKLSPIVIFCFDDTNSMTLLEASLGTIAYTLQLYFDFSGYTDMAIGCALLFNIKIPENFLYPYTAVNIQDFWRRWHITLSRWLREYLYIPLGGNRQGEYKTYCNIFMTFVIGGLWHGAAWTFVLWGALHGFALVIHRYWVKYSSIKIPNIVSWVITFTFISFAWIVFRVPSFERLGIFKDAFLGYNGFFITNAFKEKIVTLTHMNGFLEVLGLIALFFILSLVKINVFNSTHLLKRTSILATIVAMVSFIVSIFILADVQYDSEFIYFQF